LLLVLILSPLPAGCRRSDSPYFPEQAGLTWIYAVQVRDWRNVNVQHSREALRSLKPLTHDGRRLLRRLRHDDSVAYYEYSPEGLVYVGTAPPESSRQIGAIGSAHAVLIGNPPVAGARWQRTVTTALIPIFACGYCTTTAAIATDVVVQYEVAETDAAVTVPAGTYEHCLHIVGKGTVEDVDSGSGTGMIDIAVEAEEWYAPGIGLIKSRWHETPSTRMLGDGEHIMELVAFLRG